MTLRTVTVTVCSAAVLVSLHALTAPTGASLWANWITVGDAAWTLQGLLRLAFVVLGALLLWGRTRQSVPTLVGVATALFLCREPFFWSRLLQIEPVHLGDVLALLGFSLAAAAGTRWVVNRLDELRDARASHRALLAATGGVAGHREPRPGEPTAV